MREDVFKSNVFGAFVIWILLSASLLIVMPKFVHRKVFPWLFK